MSPTQKSLRATREPENHTSKTLKITIGAKKPSHDPSPQNSQETETNPTDSNSSGFIAARRKNVISYFVGNIDADVNKRDKYDYMNFTGMTPTYIYLYCGRNGSAVVRLCVCKAEWNKESPFFRQRHKHRHNQTDRYDREDHRDRKHYDERSSRYRPRQPRYRNRRNDWSHDDRYTGSYERHRDNDTFDGEDKTDRLSDNV